MHIADLTDAARSRPTRHRRHISLLPSQTLLCEFYETFEGAFTVVIVCWARVCATLATSETTSGLFSRTAVTAKAASGLASPTTPTFRGEPSRIMNGTKTPPEPIAQDTPFASASSNDSAASLKRKREDEPNGIPPKEDDSASTRSKQVQRDILELLSQHDTTPSFLQHDLGSAATEPAQKKSRLSDNASKASISAKLARGAYITLATLKDDAARVTRDIEARLRTKAREVDLLRDGGRLDIEALKQIQRFKGFEELIKEVVDKESQRTGKHEDGVSDVKKESESIINGYANTGTGGRAGTVLTLFGNAPTPKQLFSSMQNPPDGARDPMVKTELPVEEMSLPNGLTATKIVPAPVDSSKKSPTFEDAFAPPYNLLALQPPKNHKRSSTREAPTITWEFKDTITRGSRKGGYTVQSATTGDWLGYGGVDAGQDAKEKRKQRDRALSSGAEAAKEAPAKALSEEQLAREEEALFRRAYSSFAPSHDNAKAVIPAEVKSMLWWYKVGEQRFDETFALDPALVDAEQSGSYMALPAAEQVGDPIDELDLDKLDDFDEETVDVKPVISKTDVEQVLHEVSQLLETLASHQRMRNAILSSSSSASTLR